MKSPASSAICARAVKRLGEPVIRTAVARAMKEMGRQFVLGESITSAMKRAARMEAKGYTYSYDMLGEAARTEARRASAITSPIRRAITAIADRLHPRRISATIPAFRSNSRPCIRAMKSHRKTA